MKNRKAVSVGEELYHVIPMLDGLHK